jgi:tape measure domain-containing protein
MPLSAGDAEAVSAVSSLKGELEAFASEAAKLTGSDGSSLAGAFAKAQEEAEKAAASFNLFGGSSAELRRVQNELKGAAIELVRNGIDPQSEEVKKLVEEYKKLEKAAGDIDEANGSNIDSFGKLKNSIMKLAEVAAALKTLSIIKDMGAFALQTADNFQTARNQFGVLLGDMEAGAGLFNEIKAFNDVTPFDLDTLTQATNVLIAAKVPLQDLQDHLRKFGDLSQGNSQKMTSYVNAFSQAAAKGKADMQVLNSYLHQGVPILDALAKNFGVTTAEIVKMSSEGQIGFADFSKALDDLTAAGGQYFGGMELASKSLAAMQEGLKEAVNSLAASFGDMLLPAATEVLGTLTELANAVNDSPIAKGFLAGALVAVAGYLSAMAVKAGIAFAAQMSLNFAVGAMNPAVMAATVAAAGLAAGYASYFAKIQAAARESENFSLSLKSNYAALNDAAAAAKNYADSFSGMAGEDIARKMRAAQGEVNLINRLMLEKQQELKALKDRYLEEGRDFLAEGSPEVQQMETDIGRLKLRLEGAAAQLSAMLRGYDEFRNGAAADGGRDDWINKMFGGTQAAKIQQLNEHLARAREYLSDPGLEGSGRSKLQEIIRGLAEELDRLTGTGGNVEQWRKTLKSAMNFSDADISEGFLDTASGAVDEYAKRLEAAEARALSFSGVLSGESEVLRETAARWEKLLSAMAESGNWDGAEESIQKVTAALLRAREAAGTAEAAETIDALNRKIADLGKSEIQLARDSALAAGASAGQADEIAKLTGELRRADIIAEYDRQLKELAMTQNQLAVAAYAAAGASESELAAFKSGLDLRDELLRARELMDAVMGIGDSFADLGASAALSGFTELGRALGEGAEGAEAMERAMAAMAQQILRQLPMLFLQAGLQLIGQPGMLGLGLGFIAAAGSSAVISGYVEGASRHAQGGVFDEHGKAARAYAAGGAFTNQVVSAPTYFAHGGGLGLMGEAGPEAVMPLTRMPNGDLGVQTAGSGANVIVNIINNSGAEVRQEESESAGGGRQIDVAIGDMVNRHITSGKADRALGGRFNLRAGGV